MKKLLLVTLIALGMGLVVADASAARYNNCNTCAKPCRTSCHDACEVIEEPCGLPPCCLTAVEVPAKKVKHISYSWYCPKGCRTTGMDSSFVE